MVDADVDRVVREGMVGETDLITIEGRVSSYVGNVAFGRIGGDEETEHVEEGGPCEAISKSVGRA